MIDDRIVRDVCAEFARIGASGKTHAMLVERAGDGCEVSVVTLAELRASMRSRCDLTGMLAPLRFDEVFHTAEIDAREVAFGLMGITDRRFARLWIRRRLDVS